MDPLTEWLQAALAQAQAGQMAPQAQGQLGPEVIAGLNPNQPIVPPDAPPQPPAPEARPLSPHVQALFKGLPDESMVSPAPTGNGSRYELMNQLPGAGVPKENPGMNPETQMPEEVTLKFPPPTKSPGQVEGTKKPAEKKKDLSALLPLLKAGLGGSRPVMPVGGGGVGPGRAGAIQPSLPELAQLPLPGVNLRARLQSQIRRPQ